MIQNTRDDWNLLVGLSISFKLRALVAYDEEAAY